MNYFPVLCDRYTVARTEFLKSPYPFLYLSNLFLLLIYLFLSILITVLPLMKIIHIATWQTISNRQLFLLWNSVFLWEIALLDICLQSNSLKHNECTIPVPSSWTGQQTLLKAHPWHRLDNTSNNCSINMMTSPCLILQTTDKTSVANILIRPSYPY